MPVLPLALKDRPVWLSFFLAGTFFVALCLLFVPRFSTYDDVCMSMAAHGYGLAAYGSPNLVYSNVLWGYFVRSIPAINGVWGYSLATMAVLLVVGWTMLYFLVRLGAGYLFSSLIVALIMVRPTLSPQFTTNAGLLTVAAVMGWQVHARFGGFGSLLAACLLAFCGFLVREVEFFLVLAVALPLLPWQALRRQRSMQIAFAALALAIALAAVFNHVSYSGQEWKLFNERRFAPYPFSDFGAGESLKQRPEILARYHYSKNDIDLISNQFFGDPNIIDPKPLHAMVTELGPLFLQEGSIGSGFEAVKKLSSPALLQLFLAGLLLLVMAPRWSAILTWAFCLAAIFTVGMMGRPDVSRVFSPLVSLLLVAPLMCGPVKHGIWRWITTMLIFAVCVEDIYRIMPQAMVSKHASQLIKEELRTFPAGTVVSWGAAFPYELAFPIFSNDPGPRKIRLYPVSAFAYAPFSVAVAEQKVGRGMIERLRSAEGVPIITSKERIAMLDGYCQERWKGQLEGVPIYRTQTIAILRVRCRPA